AVEQSRRDLSPIDIVAGRFELLREHLFPRATGLEGLPHDTEDVGGQFDLAGLERANAAAPKPSEEIAEFENDVLSRARLWRLTRLAAHIVGREQDDREIHVAVVFDLLNDRSALVGLLMQDNCLDPERIEKANHRSPALFVVTVHDEDGRLRFGSWDRGGRRC